MIALIFTLLATHAHASCFPENTLYIPTSADIVHDQISHSAFNEAIDKVEKHYAPIVKKLLGCNLVFNRLWEDGTVNSDTDIEGGDCVVNSYGGLARYPGMSTVAAYAAVACHEVGHHMGGAPRFALGDWASVEGEADYWAAKNCMKNIGFSQSESEAAFKTLAKVLASMGGEPEPSPDTPDQSVVSETDPDHPAAQCRLDTYLHGLSCHIEGVQSGSDPKVNSCFDYPKGLAGPGDRPLCWFAP